MKVYISVDIEGCAGITHWDEANKALEAARKEKFIGNALEARLVFYLGGEEHDLLRSYLGFLPALFIVSDVEVREPSGPIEGVYESAEIKGLRIRVERAPGRKCQRCWNWSPSVGSFDDHPEVCGRCVGALR